MKKIAFMEEKNPVPFSTKLMGLIIKFMLPFSKNEHQQSYSFNFYSLKNVLFVFFFVVHVITVFATVEILEALYGVELRFGGKNVKNKGVPSKLKK